MYKHVGPYRRWLQSPSITNEVEYLNIPAEKVRLSL